MHYDHSKPSTHPDNVRVHAEWLFERQKDKQWPQRARRFFSIDWRPPAAVGEFLFAVAYIFAGYWALRIFFAVATGTGRG